MITAKEARGISDAKNRFKEELEFANNLVLKSAEKGEYEAEYRGSPLTMSDYEDLTTETSNFMKQLQALGYEVNFCVMYFPFSVDLYLKISWYEKEN